MSQSNIIMYTTEDGLTKIEATVAKFATVQMEGGRPGTAFYSLRCKNQKNV